MRGEGGVIRRWPSALSRKWLASFLKDAKDDANIVVVVAVGSAIRRGVPSEDLDLVILCRERRVFYQRAPIEIDLRVFEVDQVEKEIASGQDLLAWAVRYGRALWDPQGVWARIVSRWKGCLPLPNPETARARARETRKQLEEMQRIGDQNAVTELHLSYLTHIGRAVLSEAGTFPASRPEMPRQLRCIGQADLADELAQALLKRKRQQSVEAL